MEKLSFLEQFLRFPSVSAQSAHDGDTRRCAEWLRERMEAFGLEAALVETARHPVVLARSKPRPGAMSVLIYGHYDVQPPEPLEEWKSRPFEPRREGNYIFARGAADNKGQISAHILGVAEAMRDGDLPVDVTFLIEGEEEIGSPNLEGVLLQHREKLRSDVVVISDTGMVSDDMPTLCYSLRGIACMEITVRGPARDLHSGLFGGAIANPITALTRILATLHDGQGKVAIKGFYDDVLPLEDWERQAHDASRDEEILALAGSPSLFGEAGYTAAERIAARPTAEINGIGGGYQGEGSKTVIPREAFAKLSFRLVPKQDPAKILSLAGNHLREHCPRGVTLDIQAGHAGWPYLFNPLGGVGKAACAALQETFGREPAVVREGGSIPIVESFRRQLGVDSLLLALANPDCRAHSPNECMSLSNFGNGIRLNQILLRKLAELPRDLRLEREGGSVA